MAEVQGEIKRKLDAIKAMGLSPEIQRAQAQGIIDSFVREGLKTPLVAQTEKIKATREAINQAGLNPISMSDLIKEKASIKKG